MHGLPVFLVTYSSWWVNLDWREHGSVCVSTVYWCTTVGKRWKKICSNLQCLIVSRIENTELHKGDTCWMKGGKVSWKKRRTQLSMKNFVKSTKRGGGRRWKKISNSVQPRKDFVDLERERGESNVFDIVLYGRVIAPFLKYYKAYVYKTGTKKGQSNQRGICHHWGIFRFFLLAQAKLF